MAAYQKYKDRGLMVVGIASWDKPEASLKAIEEDGVSYPQIINAQDIPATFYGIDALPHTILFAPDGTIIARNIYGEELKEKLAEICPLKRNHRLIYSIVSFQMKRFIVLLNKTNVL